jgi:hypothetical protein
MLKTFGVCLKIFYFAISYKIANFMFIKKFAVATNAKVNRERATPIYRYPVGYPL